MDRPFLLPPLPFRLPFLLLGAWIAIVTGNMPAAAAEESPPSPTVFHIETLLELQEVFLGDLQYDGDRLYFTLAQDPHYWDKELWAVEIKTGELLLQESNAALPRLNGKGLLAFEKYRYLIDDEQKKVLRADHEIEVTDLSGRPTVLPQKEGNFRLAGWSPDGNELYLRKVDLEEHSTEKGTPFFREKGYFSWNLQTGKLTALGKAKGIFSPEGYVSPDEKQRIEIRHDGAKNAFEISALFADGSRIRIGDSLVKESHSEFPWKPQVLWLDNDRVLVTSFAEEKNEPQVRLTLFNFRKKSSRQLLVRESLADFPLIKGSPDGKRVLFRSFFPADPQKPGVPRESLGVLEVDKNISYTIWENTPEEGEWNDAAWVPDGKDVVLVLHKEYSQLRSLPFSRPPVSSRIVRILLPEGGHP